MVHKLGYGNWDDLKAEIRKSWRFRFDWFFKSRTPQVRGARERLLAGTSQFTHRDVLQAPTCPALCPAAAPMQALVPRVWH